MGWKLRDYAQEIGISDKFMILERGMPQRELWVCYAISDVFLLASKAEGLGMPLLEAMSVGLPCIATNCTGMSELLADGRGWLVDYREECTHRDPFGNGRRYWIDKKDGVDALQWVYTNVFDDETLYITKNARHYVETRTWDIAIDQVEKAILEVCGE